MGDSMETVEERAVSLSASAAKRVAWLLEQEEQPGLPPWRNKPAARPSYTVSPAGQRLNRSRPAVGAAQAVGRHNKAPPGNGDPSGAKVGDGLNGVGPFWATDKAGPFRSVTQAHKKGPSAKPVP